MLKQKPSMFKKFILFLILILIFPITLLISNLLINKKIDHFSLVPTRKEQPKDTEILSGIIPIHHWNTKQGTEVYFVPTEQLPIVDIVITLDAGSSRDGNLPGLAGLCGALLEEGTAQYTAEQIAEQFENVGAEFNVRLTRDRMIITLRSLSRESIVTPVVDLVANILANANFNEKSLVQIKNQTLLDLKQNMNEPDVIAAEALMSMLYPDHPYGHLISGTSEGITHIHREDLIAFHKQYFVTQNATITIVGGVHRDLARTLSNRVLNLLEKGSPAPPLPKVSPLEKSTVKRIPFRAKQTYVLMGSVFNVADEKEYYALELGNYILGEGSLVARLFKELRDKKGYTYDIGSIIRQHKQGGSFLMHMQTKNAVAASALREASETIKRFIEEGPTEAEIKDAKSGMTGTFALSISNNARIAATLSELTFYQIPLTVINEYHDIIGNLTRDQVHNTFKKYIQPDKMGLVIVGETVR